MTPSLLDFDWSSLVPPEDADAIELSAIVGLDEDGELTADYKESVNFEAIHLGPQSMAVGFSLYWHYKRGGVQWFADFAEAPAARQVANALSLRLGLPVYNYVYGED